MAALPDERRRFELELEFINSLANPQYVQCKILCGFTIV